MNHPAEHRLLIPALCLCLGGLSRGAQGQGEILIPPTPREFRGVWVATVANIDWPSEPGLSTECLLRLPGKIFDIPLVHFADMTDGHVLAVGKGL